MCLGEIFAFQNHLKFITWEVMVKFIQGFKNPTITEAIRFNRLCWFGHVQRMEENRISKKVIYMHLATASVV
jgi:hypothetical protein